MTARRVMWIVAILCATYFAHLVGVFPFYLMPGLVAGLTIGFLVVWLFVGFFPPNPFNESCKIAVGGAFTLIAEGLLLAALSGTGEQRILAEVSSGFIFGLALVAFLILRPPKRKKGRRRAVNKLLALFNRRDFVRATMRL